MRTVRVLLLDAVDWFKPDLEDHGVRLEIYMRQPDSVATVDPTTIDAVVLSASRTDDAKLLPNPLRDRTLVVAKSSDKADTALFRKLGYRHFDTWDNATDWLLAQVGMAV